jgi:hypothetical protein
MFVPQKCKRAITSYGDYQSIRGNFPRIPEAKKITGLKLNSKNLNLKRRSLVLKKPVKAQTFVREPIEGLKVV